MRDRSGQTLAAKLRELGHDVPIGTRTPREGAVSYAEAAAGAELILNATNGDGVARGAGRGRRREPRRQGADRRLEPARLQPGHAARRVVGRNDDSLGEQIQRAHPDAKVVKALNTVNNEVMVDPSLVPGDHVLFVCGNDDGGEGSGRRAARLLRLAGGARSSTSATSRAPARWSCMSPSGSVLVRARHAALQHLAEPGLTRAAPG